jgi:hypothetical protein
MNQFFEGMSPLLQGFWWIAIIASAIFIVQTVMTFMGADSGADGVNADFDGNLDDVDAPFQMFTFRNLVNFLLGFGWTGVTFYNSITSGLGLVLMATGVGVVFVALFFLLIRQILKLAEDNTFNINSLIGRNGDVYLTVPGQLSGKGTVQISSKGSVHELPAMTRGEAIPTGSVVKVESIKEKILIVNKIS